MNTGVLGRLAATRAPAATILIRIVVGGLFLTEGIIYPIGLSARP